MDGPNNTSASSEQNKVVSRYGPRAVTSTLEAVATACVVAGWSMAPSFTVLVMRNCEASCEMVRRIDPLVAFKILVTSDVVSVVGCVGRM